jgi:hypothetical protein
MDAERARVSVDVFVDRSGRSTQAKLKSRHPSLVSGGRGQGNAEEAVNNAAVTECSIRESLVNRPDFDSKLRMARSDERIDGEEKLVVGISGSPQLEN